MGRNTGTLSIRSDCLTENGCLMAWLHWHDITGALLRYCILYGIDVKFRGCGGKLAAWLPIRFKELRALKGFVSCFATCSCILEEG